MAEIQPHLRCLFIASLQARLVLHQVIDVGHQRPVCEHTRCILARECDQHILGQLRIIQVNQALGQKGLVGQAHLPPPRGVVDDGRNACFRIALFIEQLCDRNHAAGAISRDVVENDHVRHDGQHHDQDVVHEKQHTHHRHNTQRINGSGAVCIFPALFRHGFVLRIQFVMQLIDAHQLLVSGDLCPAECGIPSRFQLYETHDTQDHHGDHQRCPDQDQVRGHQEQKQIDEYRRNLELCHEQLSDQDDIGNACDHQPPRYTHCDLVSRRVRRQFRRKKRQRRIGRIGIQQESEGNGTTHKGKRQCDQLRLAAIFPHTRFIPLSAS